MSRKKGGAVEGAVKAQYERFPYPPPIDEIPAGHLAGTEYLAGCPSVDFHLYWPDRERRDDLDILVAGCGSSQAVMHGHALPKARITAIDLSATSIANSRRLAQRHGIDNIEFRQMSLLDVADLRRDFDLIVSTGVIHHLPDPVAGLAALRGVLRPHGSMLLMLYGRYGRDSVYMFQDIFRRMGITAETVTDEEVAQLADFVRSVPPSHPFHLRRDLYADFRPEELVDLYLHPQDRAYTVPEIYDLLADAGLVLQRFIHQGPYVPRFSGMSGHPFHARTEDLKEREQFAIAELYRGDFNTHVFAACRDDRPLASRRVDMDSAAFEDAVPSHRRDLELTGRADAPAMVINGHGRHRFEIALSPAQFRLLSLVDGQRSVRDLIQLLAPLADEATARGFVRTALKDFWLCDAVLFRLPPASGLTNREGEPT
ncbi:hypothetical protein A6A04_12195 [Paramagnetospirillum marisnigri]|uniref:Methyltransferase domain-containing protein n=1 Tax=Paramagnetospirillum marisnigri TaxID=1285242 RepID=A0A178MWP5_9PROT|nr:class I SAM-dependent methyltransferase [Paramagnetospirillum marisnigri]OAN54678.1 hypothetical protein A6A04_12195 [Paramagnetospirillum marisnigri]